MNDPTDSLRELQLAIKERLRAGGPDFPYRCGDMLGAGGMGVVFRAERLADHAPVALKIMLPAAADDAANRRMFLREVAVMSELTHPNIVTVLEHGEVGSVLYLVIELCPGGSVERRLAGETAGLPVPEATKIGLEVLAGVAHAHERGFIHRDIKPQNILLTADGIAKVSDFGLAKSFQLAGLSGITMSGGSALGTIDFMAREQAINFKNVAPPADVWSLGATLYMLLTGRTPRDWPAGHSAPRVLREQAAVPIRERQPAIPKALAAVVDRALRFHPSERFASAGEMREALARAADD